ncbi:unnamed protein product [Cunninghamella blakesleeana]
MVQTIDVPILEIPSIQKVMTIDELSSMWNVFSKCKNSIENGRRLENLSWRLWYRESSSLHSSSSSISSCSTFNSSINETPSSLITTEEKEVIPSQPLQSQQQQQQRKSKFFVDNSDSEDSENDEDDEDDEDEDNEDNDNEDNDNDDEEEMWSTYESNNEGKEYLEKAFKKKFTLSSISTISTMTTATTLDDDELAFSIPSNTFGYNHLHLHLKNSNNNNNNNNKHCISKLSSMIHHHQQQQQPISLLSKLFKQENQINHPINKINNNIPSSPELPPTLQSCCDWEKSQNMLISCKLGQSPILPDENIIW